MYLNTRKFGFQAFKKYIANTLGGNGTNWPFTTKGLFMCNISVILACSYFRKFHARIATAEECEKVLVTVIDSIVNMMKVFDSPVMSTKGSLKAVTAIIRNRLIATYGQ